MTRPTPSQRNPIKAIRRQCLACCGGSPKAVAECPSAECALFPFRSGRNPFRAPASEKQKARIGEVFTALAEGGEDE